MYNSSSRACLFVIVLMLLLLSPLAVHAAGLGKLTLNSALGQPLQAEIDIVTVNDDELSSLKVELASREAFTQAGIRYESFFSTFNVSVEPRANGDPYVVITSPQSINEPFLNILVELSWASGRLLREYTVLMDPVEYNAPEPVAPTVRSEPNVIETKVDAPPEQTPEAAEQASSSSEPAAEPKAVVASSESSEASDTYGPVVRGDNLSDIARKITPDGVNLNQMLVAMYRANREAFIDNNMNLLKVGAMLRIPDSIELTAIDAAEANAEVKIQVADWRNYRKKLVEAATESQPAESEVLSQADSGEITTTVDIEAAASGEESKEVLRLSSGFQLAQQGEGADTSMIDRLRMTEEDAIAHSLAMQEANERVAMLEKQVDDLQQLLELKQPGLAQAQVQAEAISDIDVKPEAEAAVNPEAEAFDETVEIITPAPESIADEGFNFTPEQEVAEFSPFIEELILEPVEEPFQETVQEPIASPAPLPVEGEVSYLDLVMQNVEYIVGALLVLLGALFIIKRRQNKSKDDLDADDMDFDEISPAMRNKMAAVAAAGTAASVDSDNLSSEYDSANELQAEETQEEDFDKEESFFQEEKNDDVQVAHMDLAPEPLQETEDASADEFIPDHEIELDLDDTSPSQEDSIEVETIEEDSEQVESAAEVDLDLDFAEEPAAEEDSAAQAEEDHEIEFDLGDISDDESKSEQTETDAELTETQIDLDAETEPLIEPEELSEPIEPAETSEPTLAESETDEEISISSDDQIDLMATTFAESPEDLKDVAEALDYDADTGSDGATPDDTPESVASASEEEAADPNSIDFEQQDAPVIESSDSDDLTNETEELAVSDEAVVDASEPLPELGLADINLEMEDEAANEDKSVEADAEQPEIVEDVPEVPEASEVADASDTPELSDAPDESDVPESTENSEQWQEVETKMDLAKAYQEMDDKEGAREMFEEVIRDGDKEQQEKAKALLDEL